MLCTGLGTETEATCRLSDAYNPGENEEEESGVLYDSFWQVLVSIVGVGDVS